MARAPRRATIVFHSLAHARAALEAARAQGTAIVLRTAPDAAAYGGPLYLLKIVEKAASEVDDADVEAVIDCGDDAGIALAALRTGWKRLLFRGPDAVRRKIAAIAKAQGAAVTARAPRALDLLDHPDPGRACGAYLARRRATGPQRL